MAKPPPTPPDSDIDGVHEDERPINHPDNARTDPGKAQELAREQSHGRPARTTR